MVTPNYYRVTPKFSASIWIYDYTTIAYEYM